MDKKDYLTSFLVVLIIILIFAAIDYFFHSLSNEYDVPSYYFRNKILFGILIGYITYLIFGKKTIFIRALLFSSVVSVLLQIRYYFEGYPLDFVFIFLGIHFVILLGVSYVVFRIYEKIK